MEKRDIEKEMFLIKCGDFEKWYNSLNEEEVKEYKIIFNKLQEKWEKPTRKN